MEWMKEAVDYVIFGILGLMGFVALWLTIERMLFLKRYRPGDYASEEERGIALTKNFTTLYIIYSNAPVRRAARHGDRHHADVLRHGQHGRDRRGPHHDGALPRTQGHGARSGRRDSDAHLLQRPAACDERRLKAQGLMEESS